MEELLLTPFNCKIGEFKTFIKMMKTSIYERKNSKRYLNLENIKIKFKFKAQLLTKFSLFSKEYLYKTKMKFQSNKTLPSLKTSYQISREADNQLIPKPLALKVEHYNSKSKTRRKYLKDGTHKKLLSNSETT
jgi:hypothetical protein